MKRLVLSVFFVLFLSGCVATQQGLLTSLMPEALRVSMTEKMAWSMAAEGVQIYQCRSNEKDTSKLEWAFKAPEAVLYDKAHNMLGKHYAGPTWEANDGSKVVGEVVARADAPKSDAIPWLLLHAKSTEGKGAFGAVTSIQRVVTTGGQAPKTGCDNAHQDVEVRVPYTAQYFFYTVQ